MTLYEQYCQARADCGYEAGFEIKESVWDKCDLEAQQIMVGQMRRGAKQVIEQKARELAYENRYGVTW